MNESPEQLEALLADYVEGHLDEAGTRTVESHLASSASGRALIDALRADRDSLRGLPRLTVPADLSEDLRGQLERDLLLNERPMGTPQTRRFSPPAAAIAAILMVGLGLGAVAYVLLGNRPEPYTDVALRDGPSGNVGSTTMPIDTNSEATPFRRAGGLSKTEGTQVDRESTEAIGRAREKVDVLADAGRDLTSAAAPKAAPVDDRDAGVAGVASAAGGVTAATPSLPATPSANDLSATLTAAADAAAKVSDAAQAKAIPLALAEDAPPTDVLAALSGRALDIGHRSVVIVVEQRDALDALATVSRAARTQGAPLEVAERAAQIAMPANAAQTNLQSNFQRLNQTELADAEVAVVARGLTLPTAVALQEELKRIGPSLPTVAYEVPQEIVDRQFAAQQPQQMMQQLAKPAEAMPSDPAKDKTMTPTPPAASQPATNLAPAVNAATDAATTRATSRPPFITAGERLRVTLVDPDAFDLRTQREVKVDIRGDIALPSLDRVSAAGASVDALRETIVDAYKSSNLMRNPVVKVESIDTGAVSREPIGLNTLLDVYVVVRKPTPPVDAPTTEPTTMPTTQPHQ